jgi:heat shock protein HslJ
VALLGALLLVGASACSDDGPADPAVVADLTDVQWHIAGYIDGDEVLEVVPGGRDAYIEFQREGRVHGNDGCAGFSYESYDVRAGEIRYPELRAMELPLCPLPERHQDAYLSASSGTVEYELEGDQLTLIGEGDLGVVFTRTGG